MICPKCNQTVNACAPHGRVPAILEVYYDGATGEPSPTKGTLTLTCSHCWAKLEAEYTVAELRET